MSRAHPPPPPLVDAEARRRIERDLDATFVVEAAAGTGKTTALVSRIVSVLRRGRARLDRLVAVTFTELAAGEMKLRLRSALEAARVDEATPEVERARLDDALAQLETARISTIHSLCADLLRERPIAAGVDPLFQVASEDESHRLFDRAFDLWFQRTLEAPPDGVRRLLRRRRRGQSAPGARERLRQAAYDLLEQRDFPARWERPEFQRDAAIDELMVLFADVGKLGGQADWDGDFLARPFRRLAKFHAEVMRAETVRPRDYDGLEADLAELMRDRWDWEQNGRGETYSRSRSLRRADVVATRDFARESIERFLARADADLAAALQHALLPLEADYDAIKRREGRVDFLDLLLLARNLVVRDRAVRAELQARFTHLFVDEFQDTDPLQAEILLLLAGRDPEEDDWTKSVVPRGKLFVVGDPKQSIYRFRRADVSLYERVKRALVAGGGEVLHLTTSFRSAPEIQSVVNAAFARAMQPNAAGSQAAYVPLSPARVSIGSQPAVVVLPVPRPYADSGNVTQSAIDDSLPDAVGAFVEWLVRSSGYTVTEGHRSGRVPVEARHVCLLFKRLSRWDGADVTRPYVRALEARGVPHVLASGRSFHQREEVIAVRNALTAIEWPEDTLSVYATLHGPFFAFGDDVLLAYSAIGPLRPAREKPRETPLAAPLAEVASALATLAELHRSRNRRPIADTLGRLLGATRAHAGVAIWPTGEQALANIGRMSDLARRFESGGATSFRAFLEWLDDQAERGNTGEAPIVEEGTDGVRVMTVHRAKGLEFPVVVLCDPNAPLPSSPSRHVDHDRGLLARPLAGCVPHELLAHRDDVLRRDREETIRLGYVATTRARDLLIVPGVGDTVASPRPHAMSSAGNGWLAVLEPALRPPTTRQRAPLEHAGLPSFSRDSVLARPEKVSRDESSSVAPGAHLPEHSGRPDLPERERAAVVWWDPSALSLDREADLGLRHRAVLEPGAQLPFAVAAEAEHRAWCARVAGARALGARPSEHVVAATELPAPSHDGRDAGDGAGDGPREVPIERVAGDRVGHPRGKRFGTLLHAILQHASLDADEGALGALARAHGRWLGADDEEVRIAVVRARRALEHPLLRRAFAAPEMRREVDVHHRRDDGTLLEGVIDLAFYDSVSECWRVIDFKTDVDLERQRAEYAAQLQAYCAAISAVTGRGATAVLLSI